MHYFIYPAGSKAKMLAFNLEKLGHSYEFLDDFSGPSPQDKTADINQGGGLVLLACDSTAPETLELSKKLQKNIEDLGFICVDGFTWIMSEILASLDIAPHKTAAIIYSSMSGGKHLAGVCKSLQECKTPFVQIFTDFINYEKVVPEDNFLLIPLENIKYINFKLVVWTGSFTSFDGRSYTHPQSLKMLVPHGFMYPIRSLVYGRTDEAIKRIIKDSEEVDYAIVPSKINYEIFLALNLDKKKFLPLGYPSLDANINSMKTSTPKNKILCALTLSSNEDMIIKAFNNFISKGFEIIFRPQVRQENTPFNAAIINAFKNQKGFIPDISTEKTSNKPLSSDLLNEIYCIIADYSSMAYTVPLANLRPCIIYHPNNEYKEYFNNVNLNNKQITLWDERLHIIAKSAEELVDAVLNIDHKKFKNSILEYRNEQCYNLGNSAQEIAKFIGTRLRQN